MLIKAPVNSRGFLFYVLRVPFYVKYLALM